MSMDENLQPYLWTEPANQTYEHFLLKNAARIYLVERGIRYVGTEILVPGIDDEVSNKKIVDCVGVDKNQETSYGIEAKISVADFNNGYATRCNYNYVICPKGMIESSDLPDYVGLIYVDLDTVIFVTNAREHRLRGVLCVKKAKYHVNGLYYDARTNIGYNEDKMFAYTQRLVEDINRSNLNELLYHTNYVPLAKTTSRRRRWK